MVKTFTFHYGLIKTPLDFGIICSISKFTFHYGLIKTDTIYIDSKYNIMNLHSTMVLLKLRKFTHLEELEEKFTFHYGLIKTLHFKLPL